MNRFFVNKNQVQDHQINIIDNEDIKHISKVLRLRINDLVEISDGQKNEYICKVASISNDEVLLEIVERNLDHREADFEITLFQGVPKQSKMETIVQKNVEIGVNTIVPVFTDRTIVVDTGKFSKKVERWNKVAYEAAKQSKRGIIPVVKEAMSYKQMVDCIVDYDLILLCYEQVDELNLKSVLKSNSDAKNIAVIVGPEGGITEEEADMVKSKNGYSISLGKRILRTETAGMSALSIIFYELEG